MKKYNGKIASSNLLSIEKRTAEMIDDQFQQLVIRLLKISTFPIQLNETIDVSQIVGYSWFN